MPGYNYIDYAEIDDASVEDRTKTNAINSRGKKKGPRGGVKVPFPRKLHDLLTHNLHSDIISWATHGRCFIVHNDFVKKVMPKYFSQSKLTSFQRQLNLYGFVRLLGKGPDKGGYFHEMFLRGKPNLSSNITRMRIKGPESRVSPDPEKEPRLSSMKPIPDTETADVQSTSTSHHDETDDSHTTDDHSTNDDTAKKRKESKSAGMDERTKQFSRFYFPSCTSLLEEDNIVDEYPKGGEILWDQR